MVGERWRDSVAGGTCGSDEMVGGGGGATKYKGSGRVAEGWRVMVVEWQVEGW